MKKEIAKKWVKALRSGKYKRGEGYLKQYNKKNQVRHCCLGVLCELYNYEMKKNHKKTLKTRTKKLINGSIGGIEKMVEKNFANNYGSVIFNNQSGSLPSVVKKWAGIKDSTGEFIYKVKDKYGEYKDNKNLSILNDTGCKFTTIANIIEKNVENI